jgi:cyclic pyranopterin phosphate synthase
MPLLQISRRNVSSMFSHVNGMIDISQKKHALRAAVASCLVHAPERVVTAVFDPSTQLNSKGNILATAKLAGTMGAKRTADLIPLCHQVPLSHVILFIEKQDSETILIRGEAKTIHQTGVEMEALTAVSVCALTLYDMTKAALKGTADAISITDLRLESKRGGSSDRPS